MGNACPTRRRSARRLEKQARMIAVNLADDTLARSALPLA
jgi:hypothetical protein